MRRIEYYLIAFAGSLMLAMATFRTWYFIFY